MTSDALVDRLNEAGIPCGPIYSIDQTFADPQVRHLGMAQRVESAALGTDHAAGPAVHAQPHAQSARCGAPEFGEHTDEVLAEFGFRPDEVARFRADGAV